MWHLIDTCMNLFALLLHASILQMSSWSVLASCVSASSTHKCVFGALMCSLADQPLCVAGQHVHRSQIVSAVEFRCVWMSPAPHASVGPSYSLDTACLHPGTWQHHQRTAPWCGKAAGVEPRCTAHQLLHITVHAAHWVLDPSQEAGSAWGPASQHIKCIWCTTIKAWHACEPCRACWSASCCAA